MFVPSFSDLLDWYDRNHRVLPWRSNPHTPLPDPYHVLLSEIMLQQTTVATVIDYFNRFIEKWPTIHHMARASQEEIYHAWQGLGYYSRAKNLHKCTQVIVENHNGIVPKDEKVLLTLPGVGPYTAAAIASIAFDQPTLPVDGNIIRVFSRLFALTTPLPALKQEIQILTAKYAPNKRSGDMAQALMDLGATICKPTPTCSLCPFEKTCLASLKDIASQLPIATPKAIKPTRYGAHFWIECNGLIALQKRPATGLLANLMQLPGTFWTENKLDQTDIERHFPTPYDKATPISGIVKHTFTHFHLHLSLVHLQTTIQNPDFIYVNPDCFHEYALPTLMKKAIILCQS